MFASTHNLLVVVQGVSALSACKVRTASRDPAEVFQHRGRRDVLCTAWRRRLYFDITDVVLFLCDLSLFLPVVEVAN